MSSARWYNAFSYVYDALLERTYRGSRAQVVTRIHPDRGKRIVDLACGTGQNFPHLLGRDPSARLIGFDASPGMLRRAVRRAERNGWPNVEVMQGDARSADLRKLVDFEPDLVVCTLGLSAIPDWTRVFHRFFEVLAPGGQFVIFDVHAEKRVPQTWWVELVARADLARRVWQPLEEVTTDFVLEYLPGSPHVHGGRLFVASGSKPDTPRP